MYDERSAGAPGQPADAAKSLAGICYEKLALYESPLLSANNRTLRKLSFFVRFLFAVLGASSQGQEKLHQSIKSGTRSLRQGSQGSEPDRYKVDSADAHGASDGVVSPINTFTTP